MQLSILSMIVGLLAAVHSALAASAAVDLKTFNQYSRVIIPALPATALTATGSGSSVVLDLTRITDLSRYDLAGLKDSRIKGISLVMKGADHAEIKIELHSANTDFFAYAQPDPPAVIVDVWKKKPDVRPVAAAQKKTKAPKRSPAAVAKKNSPAPAVQISPLHVDRDLFVRMSLPLPATELSGGLIEVPSKLDLASMWKFTKPDKKEPDGEAFAFALGLFKEKKYGLAIRTVELMHRDYADSQYAAEADFLRALSLKSLGEEQKSPEIVEQAERSLLEQATKVDENGRHSPFYKVIHLYFTLKEYQAGPGIKAVERLEYLVSIWDKQDAEYIKLQMLMADAYIKVFRPRFAERIYRYIIDRHAKHPLAAEAAYRTGDLLATERNYDRVIEEGERALMLYPAHKKKRAELLFNLGEAFFWKRDYAKSTKSFQEFVRLNPAATIAAMAFARLGEIAELDRGDIKAAEVEYMKAKNGFPFTLGDRIASLRLARIRIAGERDLSYQIRTIEAIVQDKEASETIRRMAQLALVDYYLAANNVDRAVVLAKEGFVANAGVAYEAFRKAYARALLVQVRQLNEQKKYAEALKIFNQNRSLLLLNGPAVQLVVSETYRGLGLYATSNQMLAEYEQAISRGRHVASANGEREKIAEGRVENSYSRGDYKAVLAETGSMKKTPRILAMRAQALHRSGRKIEAYSEAKRAFSALGENRLKMEKMEFMEWYPGVADILVEEAMQGRSYGDLQEVVAEARRNFFEPLERYEFFAGDALWYRKEHAAAVEAYRAAVEKFPAGERADRAKYNSAMSLIALKKREEAVKLLTEVREKQRVVWSQAAQQELDLLEWEKKYSAVLKGLPPSGLGVVQ